MALPPHRFLNAVYAWCVARFESSHHKDAQRMLEEWKHGLTLPLPGDDLAVVAQSSVEEDSALFMNMLGQQGG